MDILEGFFRHVQLLIRAGLGRLAARPRRPQEAQDYDSHDTKDRSPGLKLHYFASFSRRAAANARSHPAIEADRTSRGSSIHPFRRAHENRRVTAVGSARRHYTLARFSAQWKCASSL
jgi:hypothetical protein